MLFDRAGWYVICRCLRVPAPVERRAWKALCQYESSEVQTLRYALTRLSADPTHALARLVLDGPLEPQRFADLLERLVAAQHLTRHDATTLEEAMFTMMHHGVWR